MKKMLPALAGQHTGPIQLSIGGTPETCYHWFGSQKGATMRWYHYVAYFFGGAFLANTLPHLGNGISGHAFQMS